MKKLVVDEYNKKKKSSKKSLIKKISFKYLKNLISKMNV